MLVGIWFVSFLFYNYDKQFGFMNLLKSCNYNKVYSISIYGFIRNFMINFSSNRRTLMNPYINISLEYDHNITLFFILIHLLIRNVVVKNKNLLLFFITLSSIPLLDINALWELDRSASNWMAVWDLDRCPSIKALFCLFKSK